MKKWVLGVVIIALIAFGSVIGFNLYVNDKIKTTLANLPEPVFPVTVEKLTPKVWQQNINAIGFIEPLQGVDVSNEVAGIVTKINFENGQRVTASTILVSLNDQVQQAQLKEQQVQLSSVRSDFLRLKKLFQRDLVSQQSVQAADAKYQALLANIESLQANIELRKIRAPFDGILGIKSINLGQYVAVGTDLVRLEDLSMMRARFSVPQSQVGNLFIGQKVSLHIESYPDKTYIGSINAIEPVINDKTGLVMVQAEIPNEDRTLLGGMFAQVSIALTDLQDQFVVPQTAIVFALYGNSVFVVDKDGDDYRVKQVTVEVLQRDGNNALIKGDLKFDQQVVTTGILNLSNNTKVDIVDNQVKVPDQLPKL